MRNIRNFVCGIGVLTVVFLFVSAVGAAEYSHKITKKAMDFEWTVNGENLDVRISAKTEGWVAIGFNPSHDMRDANIIMGYVKDGKVKVSDEFGTSDTSHDSDVKLGGTENVSNISGKEENGTTTIAFTIPLSSGDQKDNPIVVNGETVVIMAHGAGRDSFNTRHEARTMYKVNLSTGE